MENAMNDCMMLAFKEFTVQQRDLCSCIIKQENIKDQRKEGILPQVSEETSLSALVSRKALPKRALLSKL